MAFFSGVAVRIVVRTGVLLLPFSLRTELTLGNGCKSAGSTRVVDTTGGADPNACIGVDGTDGGD